MIFPKSLNCIVLHIYYVGPKQSKHGALLGTIGMTKDDEVNIMLGCLC